MFALGNYNFEQKIWCLFLKIDFSIQKAHVFGWLKILKRDSQELPQNSETRCLTKSTLISLKSCPKSSQISLTKMIFYILAKKYRG